MKESKSDILDKLLELSEALKNADYSKRISVECDDKIINQIIDNLTIHADKLLVNSLSNKETEKFDVTSFINTISSFANHDFTHKLPVSENHNALDAVAIGINMLGDELENSVASKTELERERNRLNQAQSIAKIGSWEYHLANKELSGSDELYRIYELEPTSTEILTIAFETKYHPEDLGNLKTEIELAVANDCGFNYEHRIINNDKSIKYLSGICEPIKNEHGKVTGVKGTVQDITDRKIVEIELENSFKLVTDQNQRLLNFSYIVSHNLQSHTGNIHSLLKMFDAAKSKTEKDIIIKHLNTASSRLNETIEHLQEVVSIHNNVNLLIEPLEVNHFIDNAINILKEKIEEKKAIIKNNVPANTIIHYNPAYLESIVYNFISNAIKYSSPKRQLVISIDYSESKGNKILKITDNGLGIDLERNGAKLFGMYKVFNENKDARGIGLFITKNQIEAMGGKVEVVSKLNKGTSFSIYIK